jgi:hypothetical protein
MQDLVIAEEPPLQTLAEEHDSIDDDTSSVNDDDLP